MSDAALLEVDHETLPAIAAALDRVGFDAALQALRPDYFTAPFPHLELLAAVLPALDPALATAIRLLSFGEPVDEETITAHLGGEFVLAGLVSGLLQAGGRLHTGGYALVSRLGQLFVVSTNPYYPSFRPNNADVYMGPDSFALAHALQRRLANLPERGRALDLCSGSGIAGQVVAALRPGLRGVGVDLSPSAVAAANLNAAVNGLGDRYRASQGDLYTGLAGERFDLITANPPFIPVPDGTPFPMYGSGGEDGLAVLAPLLRSLPDHLTDVGRAVIYAEGVGAGGTLLAHDELVAVTRAGYDVTVSFLATATIDQALYTLGVMLANQRPPRLPEIVRWRDLFARLGVDEYSKCLIDVAPGTGRFRTGRLTGRQNATPAGTVGQAGEAT